MRHSNQHRLFALLVVTIMVVAFSRALTAQIPGTMPTPANQPAAPDAQAAAAQAPAAPPQICGNTAYCYETNDFAATITSFRVTTDAYKRQILDLSVRFQNKTNQQLVLGYVNGSGAASDDRGNRLAPYGPNAYRGLGLVAGNNFDPKFTVRPAGFGDAQFELFPQGWPQVVGFTYTLDLSIAEINTFEGNQHTLGEEFPLHFQGLRNGSAGISPGFAPGAGFGQAAGYAPSSVANSMSNPCATAGSLSQGAGQAAGQAASTVTNAANAISNLGSMFHRKKTQNAAQAAANAVGCDPNTAAMPTPTAVTMNAGTVAAPATNPLQQAASRATVPAAAATNPLNPLASPPAQTVSPATANKPAQPTSAIVHPATAQVAAATHTTATNTPATAVKPATAPKPSPAKPTKPQAPKQPNGAASQKQN
jgi:hypothetical protein